VEADFLGFDPRWKIRKQRRPRQLTRRIEEGQRAIGVTQPNL